MGDYNPIWLEQLRAEARTRAIEWVVDIYGRVRQDQPWPEGSRLLLTLAWLKVRDLTRDEALLGELARVCAEAAGRKWTELRRARTLGLVS